MNKKDGGQAFAGGGGSDSHNGMSMRDYFAGQVLMGLCACERMLANYDPKVAASRYVSAAYILADAMIAEREKES